MTCTCEDRGTIIVLHKSAGTDHSGLNVVKIVQIMSAIKI